MRWLTFLVGAMVVGWATAAGSTTFTYQGRLLTKGEPADGLYDLSFRLATNAEGGFLVGKPVELEGVPVVRGLFTVLLDFGPEVLECRDLWLEVAVGKTILKPRQRLTATPYAISAQRVCGPVEVGRDNYLGCFPLRYEVCEGFGLDTTLTVRVVLSYNRHQAG